MVDQTPVEEIDDFLEDWPTAKPRPKERAKGDGEENSSFPLDLKSARYNPVPHNRTSEMVKAISGLASRAAQDEAARQKQPAEDVVT